MKKRQITFWKNSGQTALRGRTVELFKVSWDHEHSAWVRDADGPYWGMYKLDTLKVRRLGRDPNDMGDVTYIEEESEVKSAVETVKDAIEYVPPAEMEDVSHRVIPPPVEEEGVDQLEAEDISVTPEGLDLGEGE